MERPIAQAALETRLAARPSAVSQALRAIRQDLEHPAASPARLHGNASRFSYRAAGDLATRMCAWRLAYRLYREKGFVHENGRGTVVEPYDAQPETFTLLAEDRAGRAAGTVSLVFDRPGREDELPCAALYGAEIAGLRAAGRRIAEVTRLAIARECGGEKALLVGLLLRIYVYARIEMDCTDFVVEVNPRHEGFYRRTLLFESCGPLRACHRVGGAPAVLLRLDLEQVERLVRLDPRDPAVARTLYAHGVTPEMEFAIAQGLAREHRPLAAHETAHLGLARFAATCAV